MWSGAPQASLQHLMTNNPSQTWHRWVRHRLSGWINFLNLLYICFFPGRALKVCQSAFVSVWESFSISAELALRCNINIKCDQSTRNAKQTAEACWDVSSLKCDDVRQWVNHSVVCCSHWGKFPPAFPFALLRVSATAHSKANGRKEFKRCLSLLAVILSQGGERHWFLFIGIFCCEELFPEKSYVG